MKRVFAVFLCIPLLLSGCFGGIFDAEENAGLNTLLDKFGGNSTPVEDTMETVPGTPEHIQNWTDPMENIPQPTQYHIDEELELALGYIGIEIIPPEDTLDEEPAQIPMDGLWNTERTNKYKGTVTVDNLQDYFAMYARDADLTVLPPVFEPTWEPIGGTADAAAQMNFYDVYNLQYSLNEKIEKIIDKTIDAHNAPLSWGDNGYIDVWFFGQINWELSMVASLTEDGNFENVASGVGMALEFFGAKDVQVVRNAAHDYTVTYNGDTEDRCLCDPTTGSMQLVKRVGGQADELFEFLVLADGRRIWQTDRIRIVAWVDGENLLGFTYTILKDGQPGYTVDDLVFPDGSACDEAWATERGNFSQQFVYDGQTLTVSWGDQTVVASVNQ